MFDEGDKFYFAAQEHQGYSAAQLYIKAAKKYSSTNKLKAGLCYELAGNIYAFDRHKREAATNYIKSFSMIRGLDNVRAIILLKKGIQYQIDSKKNSMAAKNFSVLAVLYYKEQRYIEAIDAFENSFKLYIKMNMFEDAFECVNLMTNIMIEQEEYERALLHLERKSFNHSCKEMFFDIAILRLFSLGSEDLRHYLFKSDVFVLTNEYCFLRNLLISFENDDKIIFQQHIFAYKNLYSLKTWQFDLLIKVKNKNEFK